MPQEQSRFPERQAGIDFRDPEKVGIMRRFLLGEITAEEAGPEFSYTSGDTPVILINQETYDILNRNAPLPPREE